MSDNTTTEEWVVERCSKPFESQEDASSYMKVNKFDGMVLKLQDGSHLKVSTSYKAHITEANKEAAYNWLRNNGLGDIIKNEISVSFGRGEDIKAAHYAELAKGQGLQPTQKLKVEPMNLKALVRERIEAGKDMPTEIFGVFSENKTTIKRNK